MEIINNNLEKIKFGIKDCFCFENNGKADLFWKRCFFISLLLVSFFTLLFQSPFFVDHGINAITPFLWIVVLLITFCSNYKNASYYFLMALAILVPLIIFFLIMLPLGINHFSSEIFKLIFQSVLLFTIGASSSTILGRKQVVIYLCLYVISCFLLASTIYVLKIIPNLGKIAGSVYIYQSKNSTAPLLMSSAIISFFIFNNKKWKIISFLYFLYIALLVFLLKCRAVVVAIPLLTIYLSFALIKRKSIPFLITIGLIVSFVVIFAVPSLNELIIQKLLFNNKTDVDSIFSGRISLVFYGFIENNLFVGNQSFYVDCMPILLLINFGIIGFILFLPFLGLPFFAIFKHKHKILVTVCIALLILYYINSIFEGFGIFGPGTKCFILWLFIGFSFSTKVPLFNKIKFPIKKSQNICNSVKPQAFYYCFSLLLVAIACLCCFVPTFSSTISSNLYRKIETSASQDYYRYAEKISYSELNPKTFCVGQRYEFKYDIYPENVSDSALHPAPWGVGDDVISFENNSLVATFKQTRSFNLDVYSEKVTNVHDVTLINILDLDSFPFDELNIWTRSESGNLIIKKNELAHIIYDKNYVPNPDCLSYTSSNPDVASVKNGIITGLSAGEADIFAYGSNLKSEKISNLIHVIVEDDIYKAPESIDFSLNSGNNDDSSYYTNTEYELDIKYNNDLGDYDVFINNKYYGTNSKLLLFEKSGKNDIEIRLLSEPSKTISKTFEGVIELKPQSFIGGDNWFLIDGKPHKIDLYIVYNDGTKRAAKSTDLFYDYPNAKNRATKLSNGIVGNDGLTFFAVVPGYKTLTFVSSLNHDLVFEYTTRSSPYSKDTYNYITSLVTLSLSLLIVFVALFIMFLSDLPYRRWFIYHFPILLIVAPIAFIAFQGISVAIIIIIGTSLFIYCMAIAVFYIIKKRLKVKSFLPSPEFIPPKEINEAPISFFNLEI